MTPLDSTILALFLVFMRTGTCLMIIPGFSSVQIPMRLRLYAALGITFAIFPVVQSTITVDGNLTPAGLLHFIFAEFVIGVLIALPVRLFILAVLFLGEVITQMVGLNPIPGTNAGDDQVSTTLGSMFNVSLVTLFFVSGVHLNFFIALINSYTVFPPNELLVAAALVEDIATKLSRAFLLVTQFAAPILIVALVMNLIAGLVNKLTPQIPIYFVSAPFLITVSLGVMVWVADDVLSFLNLELARIVSNLLE